jgi:hypothetical protein
MDAPFESTYLRERILKIAARQREGQLLASGSPPGRGQGLPLPYAHDLPGLRRAAYPFDYECEWGRLKYAPDLNVYHFVPHDGKLPPGWESYDLHAPLQPVTAAIDRARRLATIRHDRQELTLADVPAFESPYSLLDQLNAVLAEARQPFVVWRLEWLSGEVDRLWPEGVPQIRNEHGSAYVTGYAHDDAGNLIYLGMVGHKTVLDSIRATIQAASARSSSCKGGRFTRCPLTTPRPGSTCRTTARTTRP